MIAGLHVIAAVALNLCAASSCLARPAFEGAAALRCPNCPAAQAAREIFFEQDVVPRLGGAIAPVIVSIGFVGLVVGRLRTRRDGSGDERSSHPENGREGS